MLRLIRREVVIKRSIISSTMIKTSSFSNKIDPDQKLRDNVRLLGEMLGSVIKEQQPDVFNKVERLRKLGREVFIIYLHDNK